ncbi:hypothetical protein CAPTEDRAFT_197950 [Capitella teleta]|uniref:Ubiquitin-like protease family profile domain-containing protein n=1 Tax=Capitella teleta TaxID=283909 RepID=R7U6C7_CAPTE|nr:hypothetical protein CAPTEDRAFT_197950 [Capitella teleta]|eukprot:ELU01529.1 hypothetical protein CAPTEDRAFT_197950 [Capitella teleta]
MDSLRGENPDDMMLLRQTASYVEATTKWRLIESASLKDMPLQSDRVDCGIFAILYGIYWMTDAKWDFAVDDMPKVRRWLECLLLQSFTTFEELNKLNAKLSIPILDTDVEVHKSMGKIKAILSGSHACERLTCFKKNYPCRDMLMMFASNVIGMEVQEEITLSLHELFLQKNQKSELLYGDSNRRDLRFRADRKIEELIRSNGLAEIDLVNSVILREVLVDIVMCQWRIDYATANGICQSSEVLKRNFLPPKDGVRYAYRI